MSYNGPLPQVVHAGGTGASTITGVLVGNGTSAVTATPITQYYLITGGSSNAPNSVAPSATSGVPVISQGSSSQPVFGTAVVAGGGTGISTTTAYAPICAGTSSTGAFQQATTGFSTSGFVLTSTGSSSLPTWQAGVTSTTGTFTPAIAFGGSSTGITYSVQYGEYTQIGNVVYFSISVVLSSKGSQTGNATLTGLPVTTGPAAGNLIMMAASSNITFNVGYSNMIFNPGNSGTLAFLSQMGTAQGYAALTNTNFANNSEFEVVGLYFTS